MSMEENKEISVGTARHFVELHEEIDYDNEACDSFQFEESL